MENKQRGFTLALRGDASELTVALDLMRGGYHVYRAMGGGAPVDLLAFRIGGAIIRIEVKTAHENTMGKPIVKNMPVEKLTHADHVAFVTQAGAIRYVPELPP